jgi:hypothetical protein
MSLSEIAARCELSANRRGLLGARGPDRLDPVVPSREPFPALGAGQQMLFGGRAGALRQPVKGQQFEIVLGYVKRGNSGHMLPGCLSAGIRTNIRPRSHRENQS